MNARHSSWALARFSLLIALLLGGASILLYPGGTAHDASTRGYSFTRNFLSDLGSTVTFAGAHNAVGAVLFGFSLVIMVLVLAGSVLGAVRLLSAAPGARTFARLAAAAGVLVCAGLLSVALLPEDRAMRLHMTSTKVAFRSFPVMTAFLALATMRDGRFRGRATAGWVTLTLVLAGLIAMAHLGPSVGTEQGLMIQVIAQKVMAVTVLAVLWLESREAEVASGKHGHPPNDEPNESRDA